LGAQNPRRKLESKKMGNPTEDQIRIRAKELWEQAGKPQGRDDEFWLLAERDLKEKPDHSGSRIVTG